ETVDRDVVEHPARRVRQQNLDLPARFRTIEIVERQAPQAAVQQRGDARRRDEVDRAAAAAPVPRAVLGPLEAKNVLADRILLDLQSRQRADVTRGAELDQIEAAA